MPTDQWRDIISYPNLAKVEIDPKDYWPSNVSPAAHRDAMDDYLRSMEPTVRFVETAAFAIPEAGILISASIGLLWNVVQPGALHKYQEPVEAMFSKILTLQLESAELTKARSSLDQFNGYFKDAVAFANPKTDADVDIAIGVAKQFQGYVDPKGLLTDAFYTIKDNLPWFNASAHSLLISAMHAIVQAYKIRLMCWTAIAYRARGMDDVQGYNKAHAELCSLLQRVNHLVPELQAAVKQKVTDLKTARLNGCSYNFDKVDTNNITAHRYHWQSQYRTNGWVDDPTSKNRLLQSELKKQNVGTVVWDGVKTVTSFLHPNSDDPMKLAKPDGSHDDSYFETIMSDALEQYKTRLLAAHIDEPFAQLLIGIENNVKQAEELDKFKYPTEPEHGPVAISGKFVTLPMPSNLLVVINVGDAVWYRYGLHFSRKDKDSSELKDVELSSPWSDGLTHVESGKLQQFYVGDGYGAMPITRKLYRSTSEGDSVGTLVDTITGTGIMTWPAESHTGHI